MDYVLFEESDFFLILQALAALSEIETNKLQDSTESLEEFIMRHIHQGILTLVLHIYACRFIFLFILIIKHSHILGLQTSVSLMN